MDNLIFGGCFVKRPRMVAGRDGVSVRRVLWFVGLVVGVVVAAGCVPPPATQFFVVDTLVDSVDVAPGNGVCADSSGNCSLRAAVMEANANPNTTEIQLIGGSTYTLSITGVGEDAAATGDLDLVANTYIRANGPGGSGQAVIDAAGLDRVIDVVGGSQHFLEGLVITGGQTSGDGGGVLVRSGLAGIEDTQITANTAQNGGGVANRAGTVWMEDSTVDNNTAYELGGGVFVGANAVLFQTTVTDNAAVAFDAEIAVDIVGNGGLQLLSSTVAGDNKALHLKTGRVTKITKTILDGADACLTSPGFGTITSRGYNLAITACSLTGTGDLQGIDPTLLALADNGGPVPTLLPASGSPAIDAAPCDANRPLDARQQPRPAGPACDIGAVEVEAPDSSGPSAADLCALSRSAPEPVVVASDALTEVSGIAMSRQHDGLAWAHNDSGDSARLYLIDTATGTDLGAWPLEGAFAFDWEDMAIHSDGNDSHHLYAADIGDNFRFRPEIRVYRTTEPTDITAPQPLAVDVFIFAYPDGATDAESLFIDPDSGDFIIVSKSWDDSPTSIYRGPADTEPRVRTTLEKIGEVDLTGLHPLVTAADITADGRIIGLRTINEVLLWQRDTGVDIATAMDAAPCQAPTEPEPQGEALSFLPDGSGYTTISEGNHPPIHRFQIEPTTG